MSKSSLLLFIVFLSSNALSQEKRPSSSQNLALGMVNIQTVGVSGGESHLKSGVVVRLTSRVTKVRSYALSNAAGVVVVPLPAGSYCYDAFSQTGQPLQMKRASRERCFSVKKGQVAEVGVEFKLQDSETVGRNPVGKFGDGRDVSYLFPFSRLALAIDPHFFHSSMVIFVLAFKI